MVDRYTRIVLTVIAACLVYLCLVVSGIGTPVRAQQAPPPAGAVRPGLGTGPAEVVVVGWKPSEDDGPLPVVVRNTVTTVTAAENTTRVVLAGWEDRRTNTVTRLSPEAGLPVDQGQPAQAARPTRVVLVGTESMPGVTWARRVPVETQK